MTTTTILKYTELAPIWVDQGGDIDELAWDGPAGTHSGTAVFIKGSGYLTYRERMTDAIALAVAIDRRLEELDDLMRGVDGLTEYDRAHLRREAAYYTLHKMWPRGTVACSEREAV